MKAFYSGVLALALSSRGCEAIVATLPWRRMERSCVNARQSVAVQAAIAPDPASEGDDDVGRSPPSQQPPPRPPAVVSQATTPLWVTSASPRFAERKVHQAPGKYCACPLFRRRSGSRITFLRTLG